jgi:pSer/pThr/pTyr-binding forkhead associated (FHA) protein
MGDTIFGGSNIGKRLGKLRRREVLQLSYEGRDVPIVGKITIGRDKDNTIPIDDAMVSRHHAVVQKLKSAYFVRDLESTNGTFVNGVPVTGDRYARLNAGDVLRIGRTDISLR